MELYDETTEERLLPHYWMDGMVAVVDPEAVGIGYGCSEGKKWSWLGDTYLIHLYNNNPATYLEMSLFIERGCQTVDDGGG